MRQRRVFFKKLKIMNKKFSTIGIIGGKGQMAKFFIPIFKKQGFKVIISDIATALSLQDIAKKSDILIFSVPIHKTVEIIRKTIPFTRKNQILMDFTSLKISPIKEMLKGKSEVIGLHPMFGPTAPNLKNQTIIMCPSRTKHKNFVRQIFEREGAKIHEVTPSEHDKSMSIVQVLIHFHSILTGNVIRALDVNIKDILKYASPIYRLELSIIGRIFAQDPMLYGAIETMNPFSSEITKKVLEETIRLKKIIDRKDLEKFKKSFIKTSEFLGEFKKTALKESNQLLNNFIS